MKSGKSNSSTTSTFVIQFSLLLCFCILKVVYGADLVIEISDVGKHQDGSYRLFYDPPYGSPPPNTTIASKDIGDSIQFSKALPGTNYNFWLYYTNETHKDWLTWRVQITTAPDPPSNLSVSVKSGKIATITWSPPFQGNFTSFKLKVFGLSDFQYANKTIPIEEGTFQYQMKDLTPGASYQIHALTIFEDKESVAYTSRNFTTSKCVEVTLRSGDKITFHNIAAH